jgi:hypothetical protein
MECGAFMHRIWQATHKSIALRWLNNYNKKYQSGQTKCGIDGVRCLYAPHATHKGVALRHCTPLAKPLQ